ncbi:sulfite exporter TauE/SafE family protein [Corynebacterium frankenforstense]|uniref:sulfite exporter TauE/SafE family protein n=1 Tax=Corynebacterium frankenforstense TaxID=1230998 RepID=UPI000AA18078|nr:sulfite exporter TauE/SafE family protein [Corynebacterium frankenforstense]
MVGTGTGVVLILLVTILIGATMQRVSGMGLGLVGGPVVSLLLGPVEGILVINVLAVVNATIVTATTWRNIDLRKFLLVGSTLVVGAVPGAIVVREFSPDLLQVVVGSLLLIALGVVTFGLRWVPTPRGKAPALISGAIGGFMNTLAGIAGPAITVYAQAARWDQRVYAATLQPLFVVAGFISVVIKLVTGAGDLTVVNPWLWPAGLVGMLLGIWAGTRLSRHIPRDKAHALALALAALGGLTVLVRGASGLLS